MNTREISQAVGKDERSVQRWIKKLSDKMSSITEKSSGSSPMNPADYTLEETISIIEVGMGKNAADLYRMNSTQSTVSLSHDTDLRGAFQMMAEAFNRLAKISDDQNTRLAKIEKRIEERQALLPAPQIHPREHISMIVRNYAAKKHVEFRDAWSSLYVSFGYRTNSNPGQCAKNRGMKIIDYIEAEGQIETLESVALDIYGGS